MNILDAISIHKYFLFNKEILRQSDNEFLKKLPVNPISALKITIQVIGKQCKNSNLYTIEKAEGIINSYKDQITQTD